MESPVARLRAAVAASPGAWTWQRGSGAGQAMNDALLAWLAQADEATRGRWLAAPGTGNANGEIGTNGAIGAIGTIDTTDAAALRLLRNGRLHSIVRVEPAAVNVDTLATAPGAGTGATRAALAPATATSLRAALEQAAP
jgi:hypothetical protein